MTATTTTIFTEMTRGMVRTMTTSVRQHPLAVYHGAQGRQYGSGTLDPDCLSSIKGNLCLEHVRKMLRKVAARIVFLALRGVADIPTSEEKTFSPPQKRDKTPFLERN